MIMTHQLHIQHLLWRFGFGPKAADWAKWQTLTPAAAWANLRKTALQTPLEPLFITDSVLDGLLKGIGETVEMERRDLSKEEKKEVRQRSRSGLQRLNLQWTDTMMNSGAQLREKMAFFWHGHFASRNINVLYQQQLLHVVRTHALGNFGTLLTEVSKSAAMLSFLNNQQNKKKKPNENFAREVMELFTLGRGHYTETDVKEAARAFTGWGHKLDGTFVFRKIWHDEDSKTVLGQTGRWDGDDVLRILLEQPATARWIVRKLYRFLVNDTQIPEKRVEELAAIFRKNNYEMIPLLDAIAQSEWFYEDQNIGRKIKSPVELWVGICRQLHVQLEQPDHQIMLQNALGQVLFYPPNVAGWPGGRNWIDATSLLLRLRIPQIVAANGDFDLQTKDDDDQMMGEGKKSALRRKLAATVDFSALERLFSTANATTLPLDMARFLWQLPAPTPPTEVLRRHTDTSNHPQQVRSTAIQLMATPEYQLC